LNSQIVREVKKIVNKDPESYKIVVIGEKGQPALKRPCRNIFVGSISKIPQPINY